MKLCIRLFFYAVILNAWAFAFAEGKLIQRDTL